MSPTEIRSTGRLRASQTASLTMYLHGGPGGGLKTGYRRYGDPAQHMVVGMEQRGCGLSRPLAIDELGSPSTNTTVQLVADIEALREHLGVDSWFVVGVSLGVHTRVGIRAASPPTGRCARSHGGANDHRGRGPAANRDDRASVSGAVASLSRRCQPSLWRATRGYVRSVAHGLRWKGPS